MLSVLLPTIGRETLARTIKSIDHPVDLVVVMHDVAPDSPYRDMIPDTARVFEYEGPKHQGGGPVRDWALRELEFEDHIVFQDDHDNFVPGALAGVEKTIEGIPALYAFIDASGCVLDPDRPLQHGQVDGHQIVVPNDRDRFGTWGDLEHCDWSFIQTTIKRWGHRYDKHYFPISTARIR